MVVLTRTQLHEQVWSKTMRALAGELGVSTPTLVSACKRMAIPRPNQGYWLMSAEARSVGRKRLPALPPGKVDKVRFVRTSTRRSRAPGLTVTKAAGPYDDLPLTVATREVLNRTWPQASGLIFGPGPILSIRTTRKNQDRALGLMNRLLHFARANGWSVAVKERQSRSEEGFPRFEHATVVHVEDVDLDIALIEVVRSEVPTGALAFMIGGLRGTGAR
ncbi:MAG: hypothetical protein ABMB14_25475, partial [Myxococcota bacterium]